MLEVGEKYHCGEILCSVRRANIVSLDVRGERVVQEEVDHHPQSSRHILISLINLTTAHCWVVIEQNLIKVQLILNSTGKCLLDGLLGFSAC